MQIVKSLVTKGSINRPGIGIVPTYITVHETDNESVGANAKAHASYIQNVGEKVSWHYTVDDHAAYQHIPDNELAYHAGSDSGNLTSIGIEICVNADGDFKAACRNAAWLVRKLMREHNIPIEHVVQHYYWNKKNCPRNLRRWGWDSFIKMCMESEEPEMTKAEVQAMIDASKERVYHYWKELPEYAVAPIKALYDGGYFTGAGPSDLNLSQTKMECLVVMARAFKQQGIINY